MRLVGVLAGFVYGIAFRLMFGFRYGSSGVLAVMSLAFVFCVPFGLGYAHVYFSESSGRRHWGERLLMPWVPGLLCLLASLILAWEGIICIALFLPVTLIMSSLGGAIAGLVQDTRPRHRHYLFVCCLMLPLVISPLEGLQPPPTTIRTVATAVEVFAPPEAIWDQIKSVAAIRPAELQESWTHRLGFPRPVAATLSHEGIGGIRQATFDGGVLFLETVTRWEPQQLLAFNIRADTPSIPPTTLDEHVTIGGPYFDVLQGEYQIEPISTGRCLLHLSSRHRLSTRFNAYAGLWSDAIMQDIQQNILLVIKHRCERP